MPIEFSDAISINALPAKSKYIFSYDANGNTINVHMIKDDQVTHIYEYDYNGLNQMVSFNDIQKAQTYDYRYYPDGKRSTKYTSNKTSSESIKFLYGHKGNLLNAEYSHNNQLQKRSSYFAGIRFVDNLINSNDSIFQLPLADRHNHPATISFRQEQSQIKSYHLTDYGQLSQSNTHNNTNGNVSNNGPLIDFSLNPKVYGSGYYDPESKLQYMGARYYSADSHRFMAQDSYNLLNRYNYANANPVINYDPDGHMSLNTSLNIASIAGSMAAGLLLGPAAGVISGEIPLLTKTAILMDHHKNISATTSALNFISSSVTTIAATDIFMFSNKTKFISSIIGYGAVGMTEGLSNENQKPNYLKTMLYTASGAISGAAYYFSGNFMKNKLAISKQKISYKDITNSKFQMVNDISLGNWLKKNIQMSLVRTSARSTLRHSLNVIIDSTLDYTENNYQKHKMISNIKHQASEALLTSMWGIISGVFNGLGSRYKIASNNYMKSGYLNGATEANAFPDLLRSSYSTSQISSRTITPIILEYIDNTHFLE